MSFDRNGECWCGSGKKYKKCHMAFDDKLELFKKRGYKLPTKAMIKTPAQIEGIKKAAIVNNGLLDYIEARIKVGVSTEDIDKWAVEYLAANNAHSADLNYQGYPKSICTSVNDVVCHGIPSEKVILKEGDIVNVDATTEVDGFYADASRMYIIGKATNDATRLVEETKKCLEIGMAQVKPWESVIGDIGAAIEAYAHRCGYSVVEEFCGHGVGLKMHENPYVYHFNPNEKTELIVPGMVFTIEPMINQGKKDIYIDTKNGWEVKTKDHKLSAQWEHTILVTDTGCEILSK